MPAIRRCAKCGNDSLVSTMGIFKASRPYQCTNCNVIIKITPIAMLGMQLTTMLAFSIAGLTWVIFLISEQTKASTVFLAFIFWLFLSVSVLGVVIGKIRKHKQNPIVADVDILDADVNVRIKQADSWIEGKSFLFGLLAPIGFIAVITGIIALLITIDAKFF